MIPRVAGITHTGGYYTLATYALTWDAANQLTREVSNDGTANYTYDNEGNMLTKTEIATGKYREYTWDYRNRLTNVKVRDSGGPVIRETNHTYDAFDKRIDLSFDSDGAGPRRGVLTELPRRTRLQKGQ